MDRRTAASAGKDTGGRLRGGGAGRQQPARQVTAMIGPEPGSRPVSDEVCGRKSYATVVADPVEKERVQFEPPDAVVVADAMFTVHTLEVRGLRSNHTVRPASARPASAP